MVADNREENQLTILAQALRARLRKEFLEN